MKNSIPNLAAIWLTITFSVLTLENAFSQTAVENGTKGSNAKNETAYVTGITAARARSLVGVVVGLISLTLGWRVRRRTAQAGSRTWGITALALAFVAIILSVVHLAGNTGAFGSGGGKAGAIVALTLGLTGAVMNGFALRSRER